jgi:lactate 2-monooxygenase
MEFSAQEWQRKIFVDGFAGKRPQVKAAEGDLEARAAAVMSAQAAAYIIGGAGREVTMRANRESLDQYKIMPRMLKDVGTTETRLHLFGRELTSPFLLDPIGVLEMCHPEGDLAVARAATSLGIPYIFSNQASYPMEDCARIMGNTPYWFQLYWSKSNDLVASFVRRAELCGCGAIVVTLDTTMLGWRPRDIDLGYLPFLEGKGIAQYTSDPVFQEMLNEPPEQEVRRTVNLKMLQGLLAMVNRYPGTGSIKKLRSGKPMRAVAKFVSSYSNPRTTWGDLKFLRDLTKLPILLKGILHPDDARMAIDAGMDGVYVSNHGGRQVDGSIGAAEALPSIIEAVDGKVPVIIDSGVRSGSDTFKLLALGAKAVCIGRPYAYGLAIDGQNGVHDVLCHLMADFELTMGLTGCSNLAEITRKHLV